MTLWVHGVDDHEFEVGFTTFKMADQNGGPKLQNKRQKRSQNCDILYNLGLFEFDNDRVRKLGF